MLLLSFFPLVCFITSSVGVSQWHTPNCASNRKALVHLFEWKWTDIAKECENFLAPRGYCGVQVSPPMEHAIIGLEGSTEQDCPWWQRYQPVSYMLTSRSGNENEFIDMVTRCNNVGVRIYVDTIINHMTGMGRRGTGSGGTEFDADLGYFPGVPYEMSNFNDCSSCQYCCCIDSWTDPNIVRNCRLVGLIDLDQSLSDTRTKIVAFMNRLISIGVAGFRIDAAKHMWPDDIEAIQNMFQPLSTTWFPSGSKPFMYHEVIDQNNPGEIRVTEYTHLGRVTEFRYCTKVKEAADALWSVPGVYDPGWNMCPPEDAFTFVDNHDNQRGHGGAGTVYTFKTPTKYKIAQAISLGWEYGYPRVMSSFEFTNTDEGPPSSCRTTSCTSCDTYDVTINADGSCGNGWVCEHRWSAIAGMAGFAKAVNGEGNYDFWSQGNNAAWRRGNKGFVVITNEGSISRTFSTGLPAGDYCNVIQGCATATGCVGDTIKVNADGSATITISDSENPIAAIHVECKAGSNQCVADSGTSPTNPPNSGTTTTAGTTTIGPTTTTTPGTTTTRPEGGDWRRTVIYMYVSTQPGQDVFIRGGISHDKRTGCTEDASTSACALDVTHTSLGISSHYDKYNAWRVGDTKLDWYGAQTGQGSYQGATSSGTPLAWTTNDPNNAGYQPDNRWGANYWKVDLEIDCSLAYDNSGWFELKAYVTNQGWEGDIKQATTCGGTVGGTAPYNTNNHMIRCGYFNMIKLNSGECLIDSF